MITLSSIIRRFETAFEALYHASILPSHRHALQVMKECRSQYSPRLKLACEQCDTIRSVPHSCGHRHCPHCQAFESQRWLERQLQKRVPAEYFLITFTLPAQLRSLAWQHQRSLYDLMMQCVWQTVKTFAQNDKQLQGVAGAIAVLHTHARNLNYHPHIHLVMPAAAVDKVNRLWRTKGDKSHQSRSQSGYLFSHKALAKVFRAKLLDAITSAGFSLPAYYPAEWIVDCKSVGSGDKALVYLGRYLYRGVIQEKNIIACKDGNVTFRYQNSKTRRWETRTESGATFLWLVLQHVLPKGFRRARHYGFLHPNSKSLIALIQWLTRLNPAPVIQRLSQRPKMLCPCCGADMKVIETRLPAHFRFAPPGAT
jgi:hypothetical protein